MIQLTPARIEHKDDCVEIMNSALSEGKNGHQEILEGIDAEEWFKSLHSNSLNLVVATKNDRVTAWASLTEYREGRKAFLDAQEITFYVHPDFQRKGLATSLVDYLEDEARQKGIQNLIAILLGDNFPSIELLLSKGYEEWGRMPGVANTVDQRVDHLYFGRCIKN